MKPITEDNIETFAIEVLQSMGWAYVHGLAITPSAEQSERENFEQIVLVSRLRKSVAVLNPSIPHDAQEQAIQNHCRNRKKRHRKTQTVKALNRRKLTRRGGIGVPIKTKHYFFQEQLNKNK